MNLDDLLNLRQWGQLTESEILDILANLMLTELIDGQLSSSTLAWIVWLDTAEQWNGNSGRLSAYHEQDQRYVVRVVSVCLFPLSSLN